MLPLYIPRHRRVRARLSERTQYLSEQAWCPSSSVVTETERRRTEMGKSSR